MGGTNLPASAVNTAVWALPELPELAESDGVCTGEGRLRSWVDEVSVGVDVFTDPKPADSAADARGV